MKKIFVIIFICSIRLALAGTLTGNADGQPEQPTPETLQSWLPKIQGWAVSPNLEVFNPDNLFNRINGAAPLYIAANFREMTSLEYTKGDDYITIQAYRHATPEDAFGMYASERSPDLSFFPVGGEAQGDETSLFFFAGNMYVKITSGAASDLGDILQKIGSDLAEKIDAKADFPPVIQAFPTEDRISHSQAYITSNYIGHEFLSSVYTASYKKDGQNFQAFVIDAKTPDGAKNVLTRYAAFTKQPQDFAEGLLTTMKDRYNGDIPMIWKGRYIIGIFSESGNAILGATDFLKKLESNFQFN
ncbi:MAG: hypothetical protein LBD45_03870 [Bacteroidales bacterium]|jgi:hypothetical protein|nr:hypothetical protein [Bacteroidales bacterium]